MKDYTELFSKAVELKSGYDFTAVSNRINAHNDLQCGDWDDWADNRWYRLCPKRRAVMINAMGSSLPHFPSRC